MLFLEALKARAEWKIGANKKSERGFVDDDDDVRGGGGWEWMRKLNVA